MLLTVEQTLKNSDTAILASLGRVWGIKAEQLIPEEIIQALIVSMRQTSQIEAVWDALNDEQRGALQALMGAGGKMPATMFARLYGDIRKMGKGALDREKPWEHPASIAEGLFYRGFIAETFEQSPTGARGIIYIPQELATSLPLHKTSYANLQDVDITDADNEEDVPTLLELAAVEDQRPADTSIVDDLTTLLAYLQLRGADVYEGQLAEEDIEDIMPWLLKRDEDRLKFIFGVALSADLISVEDETAYPKRAEARRWLSAPRWEQVKMLCEAWRKSVYYSDLWHVPGLYPEPTGWRYDPVVGREALIGFIKEFVPKRGWWSIDEFIELVKEIEPDFQRPNGDYDSWYIRSSSGDYLHGFESWDAVEGALLEFYITGPLHWLGLMDNADDSARLTAYGRAFVTGSTWPTPQELEEKVIVKPDGQLLVSRKVPRVDRFQVARFTTWGQAGDPYIYKLDATGIQQAAAQGIQTNHIATFLNRMLDGSTIPPYIAKLLETWQGGEMATVTFERLYVLRTSATEILDRIYEQPSLRRYLGARLGPMACIIRPEQEQDLLEALGAEGIRVEVIG